MPHNPYLRASDADRDRVAAALREHHAQGRVTAEEFHERLERAYQAKTYGELDVVLADLPEEDLYQLPVPASQRSLPAPRTRGQLLRRRVLLVAGWSTWAFVSSVNLVIWLLVSIVAEESIFPWWILVAGGSGAAMLAAQLITDRRRR
ncbi:MAG: DUF1707 domain-containing protein [Streptosporangiales bacterium]|nr:DUF1707 domain-containing protein [Streptosporangiales bacterium]